MLGAIQAEPPVIADVKHLFALFRDKSSELEEWNAKILNEMQEDDNASEEDMVREIDAQDDYKLKYHELKSQVQQLTEPQPEPRVPNNVQPNHAQAAPSIQENKRYKLPKIDPPKFNGELKQWLPWWSLFKPIHEDESIPKEQRFNYLVQGMVENSRAAELVKSFPPTPENYDKAITSLKNRFGKEDLLVEMYVRELLKLVLNNTVNNGEVKKLSSTYDQLKTQLRALESLGVTTDMCAAMLYPLVESSLPVELLRAWQRHSSTLKIEDAKGRLEKFMDFLEAEVEADQRIDMATEGFGSTPPTTSDNKNVKQKKNSKGDAKNVATAAGLLVTKDPPSFVCIFCNENHSSVECEKARKMTLEQRTDIVKAKNACFRCLKTNHSYKICRYKEKCAWCTRRHVLLMCRDNSDTTTNEDKSKVHIKEHNLTNLSSDPEVFLQTLRVKLTNGSKEHVVRAIIDTGSHRSYVLGSAAERLGYEVLERKTMIHSLFGGTRTQPQEHNTYKVHLRSLDDDFACNFVAFQQGTILP